MARLTVARRRADWRLGRWTAKAALAPVLDVPGERIQILAAPDGAPEAWLDGERAPVSVSISHRAERALVAVTAVPGIAGCDLELVEPRSDAFISDWLTPDEQRLVAGAGAVGRTVLANVMWSAKEAATKVLRQGLRLDVGHANVRLATGQENGWQPLRVDWIREIRRPVFGWWCARSGWVMVITGAPAPAPPRALDQCGTRPPPAPGSVAGPRGGAIPSTRIAFKPSDSFSRPSVDDTSRPVSSRTRSNR